MSDDILHKGNLIQDFVDTSVEVMSTMAGLEVSYKGMKVLNGSDDDVDITSCMDITGVLGFSGGRKGSILVTFSADLALHAVGGMLGMEFEELDADVRDGIAELVNMIAGGAKTKLQAKGVDFELSIPNTVMGSNHKITAPASITRTRMTFSTQHGEFFVEVYMKQND